MHNRFQNQEDVIKPEVNSASGRPRSANSQDFIRPAHASKSSKTHLFKKAERWRGVAWVCFPFLILAVVAGGLYLSFAFAYNAKDDVFEREEFTELDIQSAGAPERFLDLYTAVNKNDQGIQNLSQQREIYYTGVLFLESERYLFELCSKTMMESKVKFLSERQNFNFSYDAEGMTFAPLLSHRSDHNPTDHRAILSDLSLDLSFILGGFVNPINAVVAEPESFVIDKLSRVVWNGEECLAVKVVSAENINATATAYINETTMKTLGIRCEFFAGGSRSYRFFSKANESNYFMPSEIDFTSHDGGTLNVQLTNIRFSQTIL